MAIPDIVAQTEDIDAEDHCLDEVDVIYFPYRWWEDRGLSRPRRLHRLPRSTPGKGSRNDGAHEVSSPATLSTATPAYRGCLRASGTDPPS